jgi:hypothetical protein
MKIRKNMIIAIMITFCFTATLLMVIPIRSQNNSYDSWIDLNGDGRINMDEVVSTLDAFGTTGDPTRNVNVTNWPPVPIPLPWYYIYSAPFIVSTETSPHPSPEGVGYGVYETCIFVHNPSRDDNATIAKKLVFVGLNESQPVIRWINKNYLLGPDNATTIASLEISLYDPQLSHPAEGYVCIISLSPNLDVNAYYTVSNTVPYNTTSIDSQIISPKPYAPSTDPFP